MCEKESYNPKICGQTGMLENFWPFHVIFLRQLSMGLSVCVVGYHVKLIVKVGACTNWLSGSSADPSAHVGETYLRISFYETNKNPPLSLAQLPPWLIYVLNSHRIAP